MSATNTEQAKLQNLYIAKPTAQDRPCFVCSKFTSIVLTSADNSNSDWFYICRSHLGDFNFCSKLGQKSPKASPSPKKETLANRPPESDSVTELINGIGSAWKSWRGSKKDDDKKDDEKDKKKEEDDKKEEKKEDEEEKKEEEKKVEAVTQPIVQQPVRFILQRDYFYLRQREHIKKQQKKQASEKLKTIQFPEVPKELPTLRK